MGRQNWPIFVALAAALLPQPVVAATCVDAVGEWQWSDRTHVTLTVDSKVLARLQAGSAVLLEGSWWCDYFTGDLGLEWATGFHQRLKLSDDGMRLLGDGDVVAGVRLQSDSTGQQAADVQADPDALIDQGLARYNQGSPEAAYRIWRPLADQGNARAENNIGGLHEMGSGVAKDEAAAAHWYGRAAAQGHRMAQFNLARLLMQGRGVPWDEAEAVRLLELAAAQDYAPAMNELGLRHHDSPDIGDHVRAVGWFRRAALLDNPFAQVNLARAYEAGQGVLQNLEAAWYWYGKAAETHEAGPNRDAAAADRKRTNAILVTDIPPDISFKSSEHRVGDSYEYRPTTGWEFFAAKDYRRALFGLNLAMRAMEDEGETAEDNRTLEEVYWGRIDSLLGLGRTQEADQTWLKLARDVWWTVFDDPEIAVAATTRLLAARPDSIEYLAFRAEARAELGENEAWFADADRWVTLAMADPALSGHEKAAALADRALAHVALGRSDAALADLDAAVGVAPSPEFFARRGNLHRDLGDAGAAIRDYTAVIDGAGEGDWRLRDYRFKRAELLDELHAFETALEDLNALVDVEKPAQAHLALRAEVLTRLGQDERAAADIEWLREMDAAFVDEKLMPRIDRRRGQRVVERPKNATAGKVWELGFWTSTVLLRHMLDGDASAAQDWLAASGRAGELGVALPPLPERQGDLNADLKAALAFSKATKEEVGTALRQARHGIDIDYVFRLTSTLGMLAVLYQHGLRKLNADLALAAMYEGTMSAVPADVFLFVPTAAIDEVPPDAFQKALRQMDERRRYFFEG